MTFVISWLSRYQTLAGRENVPVNPYHMIKKAPKMTQTEPILGLFLSFYSS